MAVEEAGKATCPVAPLAPAPKKAKSPGPSITQSGRREGEGELEPVSGGVLDAEGVSEGVCGRPDIVLEGVGGRPGVRVAEVDAEPDAEEDGEGVAEGCS